MLQCAACKNWTVSKHGDSHYCNECRPFRINTSDEILKLLEQCIGVCDQAAAKRDVIESYAGSFSDGWVSACRFLASEMMLAKAKACDVLMEAQRPYTYEEGRSHGGTCD